MRYVKTGVFIAVLLFFYFLFVSNINYFFDDMDNRVVVHENNFESEITDYNAMDKILNSSDIAVANEEDLKQILASPFLINLMSQIFNYSEEEMKKYITDYVKQLMVNTMILPEYDSKIIYINTDNSILAFTLDGKNVVYNKYLSGESCAIKTDFENEIQTNLKSVEVEVYYLFKKLRISDFSITSITRLGNEYAYNSGEVYSIEDTNNNIKLTYSLECSNLYSLYIGFNI